MAESRPISKTGRTLGKEESLKEKQSKVSSSSNKESCKELQSHPSDDDSEDNQGLQDKPSVTKVANEPVWMVPDDQEVRRVELGHRG